MKLQARKNAKFERYVFGILLAVEVVMSFTTLGAISTSRRSRRRRSLSLSWSPPAFSDRGNLPWLG